MCISFERSKGVIEHVRQLTAQVLGAELADVPDVTQPLNELGFDSLMALDLTQLIGQSTGSQPPATLLFNYPTIAALAEYLGEALGGQQALAEAKEETDEILARVTQEVGQLSDEEVESMLAAELDELDELVGGQGE